VGKQLLTFSGILFLGLSWAAFGQDRPAPKEVTRAPCAGPAPSDLAIASTGTYVHLTWAPVPDVRRYQVRRVQQFEGVGELAHVISPPIFEGLPEPGSPKLGYWDAVPDAGRSYAYRVSAIDNRFCSGTASTPYVGPLFPLYLHGGYLNGVRTSPTTAVLTWASLTGAIGYRVSGGGLPSPWIEFQTGSYQPGVLPTASAHPPLSYNGNVFNFSITNIPVTTTNYNVTAVYPNGIVAGSVTYPLVQVDCHISGFSPSSGQAGTVLTITGDHLESSQTGRITQTVRFAARNGGFFALANVLTSSSTMITTIVPDLSYYQLPIEAFPQVLSTKWGDCATSTIFAGFKVIDAPKVKVPDLFHQTLAQAGLMLKDANLVLGAVTFGSTAPTALVTSQDRAAGILVAPKTVVNLNTAPGVVASGVKEVTLTNDLSSGHGIYIWLYDYQTGQPTAQNSGMILDTSDNTAVTLPDGHLIDILAVDTSNPNCGKNDPSDTGNCVVWQATFLGSASGSSVTNCNVGQTAPCT
jgi:IPT/TIG domain